MIVSLWIYGFALILVAGRAQALEETHEPKEDVTKKVSAIAGLWQDIVSLGSEDLKWQEYGEFGLLFAPAEHLAELVGFQYKQHEVTTGDGYILELVHIINPHVDPSHLKKYPVILSHGFTQASYNFICQSIKETKALKWPRKLSERWDRSSDRNLAFLLANHGYDVWLVTSRGSLISTRPEMKLHTELSAHQGEFWEFSLDEQSRYDIPAQVHGVKDLTGANKVIFVGYSQSTFTMLGHLSQFPEFAEHVHTFVAVAPITSMFHATGLLRTIATVVKTFFPEALRNFAFLPVPIGRILTKIIFLVYTIAPRVVHSIMAFIFNILFGNNGGKSYDGILFLGRALRYPASFRTFMHFMQLQFVQPMTHYDYGLMGNMKHYGSRTPPVYNLTNIEHDGIAVYVGENDCLSVPDDNNVWIHPLKCTVSSTFSTIMDPLIEHKVIPTWNHLDYVFGKNMDIMMNRPILRLLEKRIGHYDARS